MVLIISSTACGQQRGGNQQREQQGPPKPPTEKEIKTMVTNLAKEILLTSEQETTVLKIYNAHFKEVENIMKAGRPDREDMEALKTDLEKNITAILTAEQQKLYTAYLKKQHNQKHKRQ